MQVFDHHAELQNAGGGTWSGRKNGYYIKEQHLATNECYDFATAKAKCEAAPDCHGIATQNNVCGGKYRGTPLLCNAYTVTLQTATTDCSLCHRTVTVQSLRSSSTATAQSLCLHCTVAVY